MRFHFIFIIALLAPTLSLAALTETQKRADLYELKAIIEADYGPLKLKQERFGIDLESLTKIYEEKIGSGARAEAFPYLLMQFIADFHDSHFNGRVSSEDESHLGFTTDLVEEKVVIEHINRTELPLESFPFTRGDEIVEFDHAPVEQIIANLQSYNGMGNETAAKKLAVYFLPQRKARVVPIPSGRAVLGIRKRGSDTLSEVSLPWISGEKSSPLPRKNEIRRPIGLGDWCSETSRIALPQEAERVKDVPFTAFTFPTSKGLVGFLRIPHYYPVDATTGKEVAALRFSQYERVIRKFEAETIGLIIDQENNCGGSILYANKMLSLFLRDSFTPASFEFRASQTQIEGLSRHLAKFPSTTSGYKQFSDIIEEVRKARLMGQYSTPRIPVHGVMEVEIDLPGEDRIQPNPTGYTKPIVLLINEMSGSGGDLFPAMMRDLGRAHLFGNHTMGAGGHTWDDPHIELRNSKLAVNLTRSLFYRPNGDPIENAGIPPHTRYEITMEDFLGGYEGYLLSATEALLRQLQ